MSSYSGYDRNAIADAYDEAEHMLLAGYAETNVIGSLTGRGLSVVTATEIVQDVQGTQSKRPKRQKPKPDPVARKQSIDFIIWGIVLIVISIVIAVIWLVLLPKSSAFWISFIPGMIGIMGFWNGLVGLITGMKPYDYRRLRRRR